jgi:recombination protein RecA
VGGKKIIIIVQVTRLKGELIDLASKYNVLEKSGSWYSWKGEKLGQGREKLKHALELNKEMCAQIEQEVKNKVEEEGLLKPENNEEISDDLEDLTKLEEATEMSQLGDGDKKL